MAANAIQREAKALHAAFAPAGTPWRAPLVVAGIPTFSASMRGNRASCPHKFIEELSRRFSVTMLDEFNTSKVCMFDHHLVQPNGIEGFKKLSCTSPACVCRTHVPPAQQFGPVGAVVRRVINRDVNACTNLLFIFVHECLFGMRPAPFRRYYDSRRLQPGHAGAALAATYTCTCT